MTDTNELERIASHLKSAGYWVSLDRRRTDEPGAAALIGITTRTLRQWRAAGTAPTFIRAGKLTYWISDILDFIASRENRAA